jgi:regulator of protease activity HflC (stomatin/prohibitin superfamily)
MATLLEGVLALWDRLWPFAVVDPWERAVRVTLGRWYSAFGPGTYWRWPLGIQRFVAQNVMVQTVDLADTSVETADRIPLIVSLGTRYRVTDIVRALVETQDFEDSLLTDIIMIVTRWVNETAYEAITVESLVKACQPRIKYAARRWGCEVEEVGVNTLAKHRVLRLIGGLGA